VPFYSFATVVALACAGFFYKAGTQEMNSGVLWAGLSVAISAATIVTLNGGVIAELAGQVALLGGITLFRVWRDRDSAP
jgi:alanine dehydrogenase